MSWRPYRIAPLAVLAAAFIWWSCGEDKEAPVAPTLDDFAPEFAATPPAGGGSGAIFTTTPDGSIVNENVRYEGRQEVYLDGGPPPNAPQTAAGLDDGLYVFQITDPPGKLLLSRDPARCRVVEIADGVIQRLVPPTELGKATNNWVDSGTGKDGAYASEPCHVHESPDGEPGTYAPTPDITGVGRHDTNTDVDHGPPAIVVQMMPYGLTPNPGGVYKAWLTPLDAYLDVKFADLDDVPDQLPAGKQKPHRCYDFCAAADPGFVPSHRYTKTDNFKVEEYFPPEIRVRKFHDLDGDGLWDSGEPEIGVDQFVFENGTIDPSGGGWPYDWTEPLDGGTKITKKYTPGVHIAGVPGTYTAEEYFLPGWTQTAAYLDGNPATGEGFVYDNGDPAKAVSVTVSGAAPGEVHEIVFGNFQNVDVEACKYVDKTGNGLTSDDWPYTEGWTVKLTKNDVVIDTKTTGSNGCYKWTDLGPVPGGKYDVHEAEMSGWTATSPTSHDFGPIISGQSYTFTFTNFENVDVEACKYIDKTGDGLTSDDVPYTKGWTVKLTKDDVVIDTKTTGSNGCYKWTDLGPVPGGKYDVHEAMMSGWTPTSATSHDFSPIESGQSYTFTFTNFENVKVKACKLKDFDGSLGTSYDQSPISGWTVKLTRNDVVQDTKLTGPDGCYEWTDLGPVPGGWYDVHEAVPDGWIALTPTSAKFQPILSGGSYSYTFINTPTQGCTPGFWQGGPDKPDPQAGGARLWDTDHDIDWKRSGGEPWNPYIHTETFESFFGDPAGVVPSDLTMFELVDTGGGMEDWRKLARDIVAAYLNSSWGMAYAYTPMELKDIWTNASMDGTFLYWHNKIDGANNAPGGCPISAGGY